MENRVAAYDASRHCSNAYMIFNKIAFSSKFKMMRSSLLQAVSTFAIAIPIPHIGINSSQPTMIQKSSHQKRNLAMPSLEKVFAATMTVSTTMAAIAARTRGLVACHAVWSDTRGPCTADISLTSVDNRIAPFLLGLLSKKRSRRRVVVLKCVCERKMEVPVCWFGT